MTKQRRAFARSSMVHVHLPIAEKDKKGKGSHATECVWAESLGGSRFRIKNIPFFHDEAHFMDVVEAKADSEHPNAFRFVRVIEPKGNGTILFTYRSRRAFDRCAALVRRHQATLQGGQGPSEGHLGFAAMSVPPKGRTRIERWFDREVKRGTMTIETHDELIARGA